VSDLGGSHSWLLDVGGGVEREGVRSDVGAARRPSEAELAALLGTEVRARESLGDRVERLTTARGSAILKYGGFRRRSVELSLYQRVLDPARSGSPALLAAEPEQGWLLLEDLGPGQPIDLEDAAAVVATVGTTSTAAVDPVPAIADACEAVSAWLHVDAAYAGSAWVCPELRDSQAGVERADSLVVNPHKWLSVPMDCSALWSRRPEALRRAFSLVPEYLRTSDEADSLSDYGPALGRRFRSLKLWAVLRCLGREGLQARIREHVRLAELFEGWIREADGWELAAPRGFSLVCFRLDASDEANEALVERVNGSGELFLSHTKLRDRYVLRLAIGNARTTEADVRRAWEVLQREAVVGARSERPQ
jgi:hypothetical protein